MITISPPSCLVMGLISNRRMKYTNHAAYTPIEFYVSNTTKRREKGEHISRMIYENHAALRTKAKTSCTPQTIPLVLLTWLCDGEMKELAKGDKYVASARLNMATGEKSRKNIDQGSPDVSQQRRDYHLNNPVVSQQNTM